MRRYLILISAALLALGPDAWAKKTNRSDIDKIPKFDAAPRPDDVAVIVGLEKYRDLPDSDFSAADASLFKDYLLALGYEPRNITLLLDGRATRADIRIAMERWLPNKVTDKSRVLVYYSGHGAPEPATGKAYLVPFDGNPNYLEDTGYPLDLLYEKLEALPSKETIVLLDSCFSGSQVKNARARTVLAQGARPLVLNVAPLRQLSSKMAVMTASQAKQISTSSPDFKHGIFTYHLIQALRSGKKTLGAIYDYAKPLVENDAKELNVEQTPSLTPELPPEAGGFSLAEFSRVVFPEEEKKAAAISEKDQKALEAEREKIRKEREKILEEKKRMEEEARQKERELAELKRKQEAEASRKAEEERRRLEREREELKRKEREVEKMRRKKSRGSNFFPPPP